MEPTSRTLPSYRISFRRSLARSSARCFRAATLRIGGIATAASKTLPFRFIRNGIHELRPFVSLRVSSETERASRVDLRLSLNDRPRDVHKIVAHGVLRTIEQGAQRIKRPPKHTRRYRLSSRRCYYSTDLVIAKSLFTSSTVE